MRRMQRKRVLPKRREPQRQQGVPAAVQRFEETSLRRLSRRTPGKESQLNRVWLSSTVDARPRCRLDPAPVPASRLRRPVSRPHRHRAFVPVTMSQFSARSMASLKAVAPVAPIRHRTPTPPSAQARSSKSSTTCSRSQIGLVQCSAGGPVTLNHLLGTTDSLTDPRVQFDNVNQRFSLSVTVSSVSASSTPAMWVATSKSEDPCGDWHHYRLTFHGSFYHTGSMLDFPMLGQDTNALLISIRTCLPSKNCFAADGAIFTIFGMPKSIVYSGAHVEFDSFQVDSLTAPIINA